MRELSERLDLRVTPELRERIEAWRKAQTPVPSMGEAVRMLAALALDSEPTLQPAKAVAKMQQ